MLLIIWRPLGLYSLAFRQDPDCKSRQLDADLARSILLFVNPQEVTVKLRSLLKYTPGQAKDRYARSGVESMAYSGAPQPEAATGNSGTLLRFIMVGANCYRCRKFG